jgi:hypothetical protein
MASPRLFDDAGGLGVHPLAADAAQIADGRRQRSEMGANLIHLFGVVCLVRQALHFGVHLDQRVAKTRLPTLARHKAWPCGGGQDANESGGDDSKAGQTASPANGPKTKDDEGDHRDKGDKHDNGEKGDKRDEGGEGGEGGEG